MNTTTKAKAIIGLLAVIVGLVLLVLNAADYLFGWNELSSTLSAVGIMLVVVGAELMSGVKHTA